MPLTRIDSPALQARLGTGIDLPEQAARVAAHWLPGRNGRPPALVLVLLWARQCTEAVHFVEQSLRGLLADLLSTPLGWSESQAVRQVLAALNQQLYQLRSQRGLPWEVSAGVLLVQGDEASFFQAGDCGLLRWQQGCLQNLVGQASAPLGLQAELGLVQHGLPLDAGHLLWLAPQPLLAVLDHERLSRDCGVEDQALEVLLAPLLEAPGAAAVVRGGEAQAMPLAEPPPAWPARVAQEGTEIDGWRLREPCDFGPPGRLWRVEREGREAWLWLAERAQDEALRQREWLLRRAPAPGLPLLPACALWREEALCLVAPLPGRVLSLAAWRAEQAPVGAAQALALLRALTAAVRALQRRGVMGLVLDPRHILVGEQGQLCLLPEQAACWPDTPQQVPQTDLPLAPEVRSGQKLDGSADQFALAALTYWLLSGEWPAVGARRAHYRPLARAGRSLPEGWDGVLARALAPQPAARFAALSEFVQALERPLEPRVRMAPAQRWPAVWRLTAVLVLTLQLLLALQLTLI